MRRLVALSLFGLGIAGVALAGTAAPEIDASSGIAAITLLSGGVLVLRTRRRKQ